MRASAWGLLALVAVVPALAGCLDPEVNGGRAASDEVGGPGFHIRSTDFFHSYGASGDRWRDAFTWQSPEGRARLEVKNALRSGSELVQVLDAAGSTVFSEEFHKGTRSGEFLPGSGAPGAWTIVIERREAVGQFDLHVWRDVQASAGGSAPASS